MLVEDNVEGLDLAATLLAAFSGLGVVLAALGIFGVISYSVIQRTRELGIRMAIGAQSREVLRLVLQQGFSWTLIGAAIGLAGAAGVAKMLSNDIPGLPAGGPVTLLMMTGLLLFVALLACYLPARRASKLDPMSALRQE